MSVGYQKVKCIEVIVSVLIWVLKEPDREQYREKALAPKSTVCATSQRHFLWSLNKFSNAHCNCYCPWPSYHHGNRMLKKGYIQQWSSLQHSKTFWEGTRRTSLPMLHITMETESSEWKLYREYIPFWKALVGPCLRYFCRRKNDNIAPHNQN